MKQKATFIGVIYKLGINPVVDPPDEVLAQLFEQAGRSKGPIPVCGRLNGAEFIQTLVKYKGAWRLYINGRMLNDSGLNVRDKANIEIEFDSRPRDVAMPAKLRSALQSDKNAKKAFGALSPSRQKEIFRYVNSLRTEESIARNVDKIIRQMKGDEIVQPLAIMRKRKKS
jgi:Bacteriocin-protection, YdeI or OmpD-Associated